MTPRRAQRTTACTKADARSRLVDARAFLEVAEVAENTDVVATNAVHAAIAAADVLCCVRLAMRSSSSSHADAVDLLRRLDGAWANGLRRCLDLKARAAYETRDVSARDAATVVKHARTLVEAAEQEYLAAP